MLAAIIDLPANVGYAAVFAAIIGDNLGFAIGRQGGRRQFARPGPFHRHRLQVLEHGEPFFARHGPKAVFLA